MDTQRSPEQELVDVIGEVHAIDQIDMEIFFIDATLESCIGLEVDALKGPNL
jgi:hypothetical protein